MNWNKEGLLKIDGIPLIPTIIQDIDKNVLGLCYSSEESLKLALTQKQGIYYSRKRKSVWIKSKSGINSQKLINVYKDCDNDTLLFIVAQRGHFCHLNIYSCFNKISLLEKNDIIRIGITIGHSEQKILKILDSIGIYVYKKSILRINEYFVKSHLHPNIEIIGIKPKDIQKIYDKKLIDIVISYDDVFIKKEFDEHKIKINGYETKITAIKQKNNEIKKDELMILSEYPKQTKEWSFLKDKKFNIIETSGNTEELITKKCGDIGIVLCDTENTIQKNNLEIIEIIETLNIHLYFNINFYKKNPRLIREIKNCIKKDNKIYFYSVDTSMGFLSNFYPAHFKGTDGFQYKTSEHYYQAHKFQKGSRIFIEILSQKTAKECYEYAWKYENEFRKDWSQVKDNYMFEAITYKFEQNPHLMQKLVDTYPKILIEHSLNDFHYGCGIDGTGKNILGKMLMILRETKIKEIKPKL